MEINELYLALAAILFVPLLYMVAMAGAYFLLEKNSKALAVNKIQPENTSKKILAADRKHSAISLIIFMMTGGVLFFLWQGGYTGVYWQWAQHGWVWLCLSLPVLIILHDTYFYWTHRLLHTEFLFSRVHRIHHQSTNPTAWTALSFHPVEAILQALFIPLVAVVLPLHIAAINIFLLYMVVKNVVGHCGYEFFPNSLHHQFFNWRNAATYHNLHHAAGRCNYGLYFTWWDKWMKTFRQK